MFIFQQSLFLLNKMHMKWILWNMEKCKIWRKNVGATFSYAKNIYIFRFICRWIFDLSVNSFIEMLCVAQIRFWKERFAFSIFTQHLFQAWSNLRLNVFFRGTTVAVHWSNVWDLNLQTFSSPNLTPLLHHPNLSLKH